MEVRFENGWAGRGWVLDPRTLGWITESAATVKHMVPSVDVIEDKDGYHFYFEMPGLTNESIDARVENGRLLVAAERKRPEWPQETEVHIAERSYGTIHRAFELPNDKLWADLIAIMNRMVFYNPSGRRPNRMKASLSSMRDHHASALKEMICRLDAEVRATA